MNTVCVVSVFEHHGALSEYVAVFNGNARILLSYERVKSEKTDPKGQILTHALRGCPLNSEVEVAQFKLAYTMAVHPYIIAVFREHGSILDSLREKRLAREQAESLEKIP